LLNVPKRRARRIGQDALGLRRAVAVDEGGRLIGALNSNVLMRAKVI
jgi:hypothetical protein